MNIRSSHESDRSAIGAVHLSAFGSEEGLEIVGLVNGLLDDDTARPTLSLIAEADGGIVGHILFTNATLRPEQPDRSIRLLAPLAVSPDRHKQGIGGGLIAAGLERLKESSVDLVFVLGHPEYYPRFGFRPAGALGLDAPYPIPPHHADAWMVHELRTGVLPHLQGVLQCAAALNRPEYWLE